MKNKKIISSLGLIGLVLLLGVAVFAQDFIFELLFAGGGVSMAVFAGAPADQTVQGTVTSTLPGSETGNFKKPEIDKPSFGKKLTKVFPAKFMMDTITREMDSGTCDSDVYKYPSVISRAMQATVKTASTPAAAPAVATIELVSAHMLSLNGNLLVPSYTAIGPTVEATKMSAGVSSLPLVLHIVAIDYAANTIRVYPVNASKVPALEVSAKLYRMGVAMDQLAAMSSDPSVLPTYDENYCQTNMCTISEGFFQKIQEKETPWGMAEMKEMSLYDFRYQNEMNLLFGAAAQIVDPVSQQRKYMMDGLVRKVGDTVQRPPDMPVEKFVLNATAKVFDGNNGSDTRLMFYGSDFGLALSESATFQKQLEAGKTEVVLGITWNVVETNNGRLLCKKHDIFAHAGYGGAATIVDPANIRKVVQVPLHSTKLDLEKAGKQRSEDVRIDETFTLEVTNKDTHGLLFV